MSWAVTNIQKGGDIRDFIVWDNTSDADISVSVTFYFDGQAPIAMNNIITTQAFRRGGLNIDGVVGLPSGSFSAVVTSSQPLVVAISHFDPTGDKYGFTALGVSGLGQNVAVLPFGNLDNSATETLSFLNTGSTAAVVTLIFSFEDGSSDLTVTPPGLILASNRRVSFDPSTESALAGKRYSVRYSSGSAKIFAGSVHRELGDDIGNPFAYTAATRHDFAEFDRRPIIVATAGPNGCF